MDVAEAYKRKIDTAASLLPNAILMEASSLSEDNIVDLDNLSELELDDQSATATKGGTRAVNRPQRSMSTSYCMDIGLDTGTASDCGAGNYENKYQKWKQKCKHQRKQLRLYREKINAMQDEQEDEATRLENETEQQFEMKRLQMESITFKHNTDAQLINKLKKENQRLKEENEKLLKEKKNNKYINNDTVNDDNNNLPPRKPQLLQQSHSMNTIHNNGTMPAFHEYYSMPPYPYWYPGYPGHPGMPMPMPPKQHNNRSNGHFAHAHSYPNYPPPMHPSQLQFKTRKGDKDGNNNNNNNNIWALGYNNNSNDEGCINMEPRRNPNQRNNRKNKKNNNNKKKKKKIPAQFLNGDDDDEKEEQNSKWPLLKAIFPGFGCGCSGD